MKELSKCIFFGLVLLFKWNGLTAINTIGNIEMFANVTMAKCIYVYIPIQNGIFIFKIPLWCSALL